MTNRIPILLFKVGSLVLYPSSPIDLHRLQQFDLLQLHELKLGNCRPKPDNLRGLWSPYSVELEVPLMKRQLKHRRNKDSKLNKEFKRLEADIYNLKSQMDSLKDKITKAFESTNARFKRKKIRSMARDFDKISEKLKKSEAKLESVEQRVPIDPIRGAPLNYILPIKTNA